jgi:predicted nucleic acid-binding protein
MPRVIVLDTFPVSSVCKRPGRTPTELDRCFQWIEECEDVGHSVLIPAIAYYEVLREIERRKADFQRDRLKAFCLQPHRFVPCTTEHLEEAARLWGEARRSGYPTADPQALDCDVILAAQARSLGMPSSDYVIATSNVGHLTQFVPANLWTNIDPQS